MSGYQKNNVKQRWPAILSFALGIGLAVLLGGIITQYLQWEGCLIFLLLQGFIARIGTHVFDETLRKPKLFPIPTLLNDYKQAPCSFKFLAFSSTWGVCSAVGYCYSAAAPQISSQYLDLSASQYGYWNILNII